MRDDISKEKMYDFPGERTLLTEQKEAIRSIKKHLSEGEYDKLESKKNYLMKLSESIADLYEKWELKILEQLRDEIKLQKRLNELNKKRVSELGEAEKLEKRYEKEKSSSDDKVKKEMEKSVPEAIDKIISNFDKDEIKSKIEEIIDHFINEIGANVYLLKYLNQVFLKKAKDEETKNKLKSKGFNDEEIIGMAKKINKKIFLEHEKHRK